MFRSLSGLEIRPHTTIHFITDIKYQHKLCTYSSVLVITLFIVMKTQVDVAVVKFVPLVQPAIDIDYETLEMVVKAMFQHRRKIILKGVR